MPDSQDTTDVLMEIVAVLLKIIICCRRTCYK